MEVLVVSTAGHLGIAAVKVIDFLKKVKSINNHNTKIAQKIDGFITYLKNNIDRLKHQPPKNGDSWALAIERDLHKAARDLEVNLKNGNFRKHWDAKKTRDELERLRRNLID